MTFGQEIWECASIKPNYISTSKIFISMPKFEFLVYIPDSKSDPPLTVPSKVPPLQPHSNHGTGEEPRQTSYQKIHTSPSHNPIQQYSYLQGSSFHPEPSCLACPVFTAPSSRYQGSKRKKKKVAAHVLLGIGRLNATLESTIEHHSIHRMPIGPSDSHCC